MRAIMIALAMSGIAAPVLADELVGSFTSTLFGYGGTSLPDGAYLGLTVCPGGPGTNVFCNTMTGTSPPFALGPIGLIPSSASAQTFNLDETADPALTAVFAALEATPFNRNLQFCYGDAGSSFDAECADGSGGGGGPSDFLPGYWLGSNIDRLELIVHAFDFTLVDLADGPQYGIRNLDGFGGAVGSPWVIVELNFYGTRGDYQDGRPGGIPEPQAWALMVLGFGLAGWGLQQRLRRQLWAARNRLV